MKESWRNNLLALSSIVIIVGFFLTYRELIMGLLHSTMNAQIRVWVVVILISFVVIFVWYAKGIKRKHPPIMAYSFLGRTKPDSGRTFVATVFDVNWEVTEPYDPSRHENPLFVEGPFCLECSTLLKEREVGGLRKQVKFYCPKCNTYSHKDERATDRIVADILEGMRRKSKISKFKKRGGNHDAEEKALMKNNELTEIRRIWDKNLSIDPASFKIDIEVKKVSGHLEMAVPELDVNVRVHNYTIWNYDAQGSVVVVLSDGSTPEGQIKEPLDIPEQYWRDTRVTVKLTPEAAKILKQMRPDEPVSFQVAMSFEETKGYLKQKITRRSDRAVPRSEFYGGGS